MTVSNGDNGIDVDANTSIGLQRTSVSPFEFRYRLGLGSGGEAEIGRTSASGGGELISTSSPSATDGGAGLSPTPSAFNIKPKTFGVYTWYRSS